MASTRPGHKVAVAVALSSAVVALVVAVVRLRHLVEVVAEESDTGGSS